jgi:hypothetical protein
MTKSKKSLEKPYDEAVFEVAKRISALQVMNIILPVTDQNQAKILEDSVSHLEPFWTACERPVEDLRELLFSVPLDEEWSVSAICTFLWSEGIIR